MTEESKLQQRRNDWIVTISKGTIGAIPFVGNLLAEIVGTIVPNQRIDRLQRYVERLEARLSRIDTKLLQDRLQLPETVDVLEDGFIAAARTLTDERREQIAALIAEGISGERIQIQHSKRLLQILAELSEYELLLLTACSLDWRMDHPFIRKHITSVTPPHVTFDCHESILNESWIHESYTFHLVQLGLIELRGGKKGTAVERSSVLKAQDYAVARTGRLLLDLLELPPKGHAT